MREAMREALEHRKARSDMLTRVAVVLVILCLLVAMFTMVVGVFQARDQARANGELSATVLDTQDLLVSCTTPKGDCYRENQVRTAEIVAGINAGTAQVIAAALTCQDRGIQETHRLVRCIEREIEQEEP